MDSFNLSLQSFAQKPVMMLSDDGQVTRYKNHDSLPFDDSTCLCDGPGSSVGIVTGYGLDGPGIESRWR
jgi:hypothetical protein